MGGKWNSSEKSWDFDERNAEIVKPVLFDIYGTDGENFADTVSVKIKFIQDRHVGQGQVTFLGKVIARAFGRDSGAKLGNGIVMIEGKIDSGGSVKNWETRVDKGSVFVVHDIPRHKLDSIPDYCEVIEVYERNELPNPPLHSREDLIEEKERLLKRISEIDALLERDNKCPEIRAEILEEFLDK